MAKVYPTDSKCLLLVADEIKYENKKGYFKGCYAAGKVTVASATGGDITLPSTLPALSFLWVFVDGEGDFKAKVTIKSPKGTAVAEAVHIFSKKAAGEADVVTNAAPFAVDAFGAYKFIIELDSQQQYEREFTIDIG